jgi:hypothetical protein
LRLRNSDLSNLSRFKSNTLKNLTLWQKEAAFDISYLEMEGSAADDVEMRSPTAAKSVPETED